MEKTNEIEGKKICLSVDGSVNSESAVCLVLEEILNSKLDSILAIHIKYDNQNSLPFNLQVSSIKSYIESKLVGSLNTDKYFVSIQDPEKKFDHALSQVYNSCVQQKVDFIAMGFQGTSNKKNLSEISRGIKNVVTSFQIPSLIIKEYIPRKDKKNNAYIWMACIDSHSTRGWKAFESSSKFINPKDKIICGHFSVNDREKELIREEFVKHCDAHGFKNHEFLDIPFDNKKTVGAHIYEYVNYIEDTPDFIILGHNPGKYLTDNNIDNSPAIEVMKKAQTNIIFHQ